MSLLSVAVCRVAISVLPAVLWRIAFPLFAGCLVSFAADVSPFYLPIRNNDVVKLKELLRAPGPKARDARGNSPLMYAAALGTPDVLRLLLDSGADPNAANELGATPLMWCAGDAAKVKPPPGRKARRLTSGQSWAARHCSSPPPMTARSNRPD